MTFVRRQNNGPGHDGNRDDPGDRFLGTDVATGIANELGLKLIHCDIAHCDIAAAATDEPSWTEDSRPHINSTSSVLERWLVNRHNLARYTSDEILRLAQRGNLVIRGWGAGALLRDIPHISVRVCAPLDFRVRNMMERLDLQDPDAVRMEIETFDASTRAFSVTHSISTGRMRCSTILFSTPNAFRSRLASMPYAGWLGGFDQK